MLYGPFAIRRRPPLDAGSGTRVAAAAAVAAVVAVPAPPTLAAANRPPVSAVTDPAALVHPMDGTGTGPVTPGTIGEFPGADLPFGMIQWSPDTSPNAVQSGGGYAYADSRINGFSLTHLSGTGCPSFQDVPVLPTVGALGADPETETDAFSHRDEEASPGRYQVSLDPGPVSVALSVTTRTGIARFAFPAGSPANLLFKVAGSVNPVTAASVQVVGRDEVVGQVSSGQFCGTGTNYTLHFVALFDRPFSSAGTWVSAGVSPGSSSCSGPTCGAFVTFDPSAGRDVLMKVGISFVSTADARENLRAEDPGWSLSSVSTRAREAWNALLGRIAVSGGTPAEQHTFYTALYHSLLFPNVVSDVNGDYPGSDGKVHAARWSRRVRRLLGVGRLSERNPARVIARAPPGREHGPVARRRRRAGRVVAQVGHRGRGRGADERGLGGPDHRGRLRHGGAELRRGRRRSATWSRARRRTRRATASRSSGSTWTSTSPSTTSTRRRWT